MTAHTEPITAAMVAQYLLTEVPPDTLVVGKDGDGDGLTLDRILDEIAMEPERYQEG